MKGRFVRNLFESVLLLTALVAVALLSAVLTMHFAIHGAEVRVPALRGMTVSDAGSQTAGLDLNLSVDHRYYSTDVAAGHILSQSPAPGTVVRREWQVRVAVSLGPQKVEVPNVLGMQERTAMMTLRGSGLESGMSAHLADAHDTPGTVIAQDPPPKAHGIEQPSVNLLVASADESAENGYVMPNLEGKSIGAVAHALELAGIKLAPLRYVEIAVQPIVPMAKTSAPPAAVKPLILPGAVIEQQPASGTRIAVGDTVRLSVAR